MASLMSPAPEGPPFQHHCRLFSADENRPFSTSQTSRVPGDVRWTLAGKTRLDHVRHEKMGDPMGICWMMGDTMVGYNGRTFMTFMTVKRLVFLGFLEKSTCCIPMASTCSRSPFCASFPATFSKRALSTPTATRPGAWSNRIDSINLYL